MGKGNGRDDKFRNLPAGNWDPERKLISKPVMILDKRSKYY